MISNGRNSPGETTSKTSFKNDEESEIDTCLQYEDQTPVSGMHDDSADSDPASIFTYAVKKNDLSRKVLETDSDPSPSDPSYDDRRSL